MQKTLAGGPRIPEEMEKEGKGYIIVRGATPGLLAHIVQHYLFRGWTPYGEMVLWRAYWWNRATFAQAMRYQEPQ